MLSFRLALVLADSHRISMPNVAQIGQRLIEPATIAFPPVPLPRVLTDLFAFEYDALEDE